MKAMRIEPVSLEEKLAGVVTRHDELAQGMAQPDTAGTDEFIRMSKEYSDLTPVVETIRERASVRAELDDLAALIDDTDTDDEMRGLAEEEREILSARLPDLDQAIRVHLLPRDAADEKNAILEVRAGTGGDEAALFAADLFRMYQRYSEVHRWKFEVMQLSETGIGGYKEAIASVSGKGVFARLKFESGVHRVQRVPTTESSGRIHTSAATVAVMPEAEEVDIEVKDADLRIDVFRASGPGGQSVNTTDSAVRITHLPTGIVVSQQDEKSQHKNKAKGLRVLRSRIYEAERQARDAERAAQRKTQVGTGDRSERIRTYNFPQGRVTDHRINLTMHKLEGVMNGDLDEVIDALVADDQASRLAEVS
jgi:peptide chain release factor 1